MRQISNLRSSRKFVEPFRHVSRRLLVMSTHPFSKTHRRLCTVAALWFAGAAALGASVHPGQAQTTYNARDEFALVQGGTSGVWRYGYTASDGSDAFLPFTHLTTAYPGCSPVEGWQRTGGVVPEIFRFNTPTTCNGTPPDSLRIHPGDGGQRSILRWVAPAAGTYQITGALQKADDATTDIRILKNEDGTSPLLPAALAVQSFSGRFR
jgi:hypothetical protein